MTLGFRFHLYAFRSGTFQLLGDGGYLNVSLGYTVLTAQYLVSMYSGRTVAMLCPILVEASQELSSSEAPSRFKLQQVVERS
jgi:hypothetical protein